MTDKAPQEIEVVWPNDTEIRWIGFVLYNDQTGEKLAEGLFDQDVGPGETFTGTLKVTLE